MQSSEILDSAMTTGDAKPDLSSLRIHRDRPTHESRKGAWKYIAGAGILLSGLLLYFMLGDTFSPPVDVDAVTAAMTFPADANALLTASGYVVAQQKASIASKATGRLVYLGVEEGDVVTKGDVIAKIEDQDVQAAVARAEADLQLARADSLDAVQSHEREKVLFAGGLTSQAALDAAQARRWRTDAAISSARAALGEARVALENTRIRAPFNGTVLTKDADVGEIVAPFASSANSRAAVVTMADMSSLEVEADVSESNITRVTPGQHCDIVLDAYPEVRYPGYVHKIVPTADRAKATVLTKVRFSKRDDRVLPEMSAKVSFLSERPSESESNTTPRLTVNASAIVRRGDTDVAFLIEGDRVRVVPVKTGDRFGERVEIREGLAPGDQIVGRPNPELSDGTRIKVR
jgi:RND family efflux transporter MFP subunit